MLICALQLNLLGVQYKIPVLPVDYWLITNIRYLIRYCVEKKRHVAHAVVAEEEEAR